MNIQAKLLPTDDFWNAPAHEKAIKHQIDVDSLNLRSAMALAEKMMALKASPGWEPFVKTIEDCRSYRQQELVMATTDTEMRILQGRCKELSAIISLMKHTEQNMKVLADRLEGIQEQREALIRPDGKVKPRGPTQ